MYRLTDVARHHQQEMLEQAQLRRTALQAQALNRTRRRVARAERRMSRARAQASRLRQQLEAEA
jgi:hypothetical protein